jgi:hypothetical protein
MSKAGIKTAGSDKTNKLPGRVRAAGFREGFKSFIILFSKLKFHVQGASHLAHREAMRDSGAKGANYFQKSETGAGGRNRPAFPIARRPPWQEREGCKKGVAAFGRKPHSPMAKGLRRSAETPLRLMGAEFS